MRRHWPFSFLIAFVLILSLRPPRPVQWPVVSGDRASSGAELSPEIAQLKARPGPSAPAPSEPEAAEEGIRPAGRSSVLAAQIWTLQRQNEDGSWGDLPT